MYAFGTYDGLSGLYDRLFEAARNRGSSRKDFRLALYQISNTDGMLVYTDDDSDYLTEEILDCFLSFESFYVSVGVGDHYSLVLSIWAGVPHRRSSQEKSLFETALPYAEEVGDHDVFIDELLVPEKYKLLLLYDKGKDGRTVLTREYVEHHNLPLFDDDFYEL